MADDLISETFLRLSKWKKYPSTPEEMIKVFVSQMKREFTGKRNGMDKLYSSKDSEIYEGRQIKDYESMNDIYLNCEQTNEATRDVIDLFSHLGREDILNYIRLSDFRESLPGWDKEIFDCYFEKGMSSRDIAKGLVDFAGYETNYQRINELINKVKDKIKVWKQLNS